MTLSFYDAFLSCCTVTTRGFQISPTWSAVTRVVFTPTGGVDLTSAFRFAGLGLPEFHLLDRDVPPVTQTRHWVAAMVNLRLRCRAVVTSKRTLENYLLC